MSEEGNAAAAPETTTSAEPVEAGGVEPEGQEGAEEGAQAAEEGEPEPQATPEKHRVKIDGEERELSTEELYQLAQLGGGARRKIREAHEAQKEAERLRNALKDRRARREVFQELGIDYTREIEEELYEYVQQASMTPEQRQQLEMQQRLAEYERMEEERRRQEEEQQQTAAQRQETEQMAQSFQQALESAGLAEDGYAFRRMVWHAEKAMEQGIEVPPEQLAQHVRKEMEGGLRGRLKAMKPEELIEWVGEDLLKAIRKADLERVSPGTEVRRTQPGARSNGRRPEEPRKRMSLEEWQDQMHKRVGLK